MWDFTLSVASNNDIVAVEMNGVKFLKKEFIIILKLLVKGVNEFKSNLLLALKVNINQ